MISDQPHRVKVFGETEPLAHDFGRTVRSSAAVPQIVKAHVRIFCGRPLLVPTDIFV
jgi:hypothetical protein